MGDYIQMFFFILFGMAIAAGMGIVDHMFGDLMEAVFFFVAIVLFAFCLIKVIQNYEKKRSKDIKKAS